MLHGESTTMREFRPSKGKKDWWRVWYMGKDGVYHQTRWYDNETTPYNRMKRLHARGVDAYLESTEEEIDV
jgi:hypothetical protein